MNTPRWSPESNAKRAAAMRGRRKSPEHIAKVTASRRHAPGTPEWDKAYAEKLAEVSEERRWERIKATLMAGGFDPDSVKVAVE